MNARSTLLRAGALLSLTVVLSVAACNSQAQTDDESVRSHLRGVVTVSAEIDTVRNYSGFEVIVGREGADGLDTLAYAVTEPSGAFQTDVEAPRRGVYPLIIARQGQLLRVDQLVVGEGDSASFTVELPARSPIRVRSQENSAWSAYQNTRALHNQGLIELIQEGETGNEVLQRQVMQASSILWSLRDNYEGTVGADIAAAESITMLEGWNDSLLVERSRLISEDNPSYVDVVRAARRAEARLNGQQSALDLMQEFQLQTEDRNRHAAIQSEIVIAYMDSLDEVNARRAARNLQQSYPRTVWAEWADEALYEIENLLPGRPAPAFTVTTREGETLSLGDLSGRYVLLEFYVPESDDFRRQLDLRNALVETMGDSLEAVTLSLQSDADLVEAFFEDREIPGRHVVLEEGAEAPIVEAYNVSVVPTRYLIDPDGRIVRRYIGESLFALQQELLQRQQDAEAEE